MGDERVTFQPPALVRTPPGLGRVALAKARDIARNLTSVSGGRTNRIDPRKGQSNGLKSWFDPTLLGEGRPLAQGGPVQHNIIYQLANRDDIVFSIRRTLRNAIGEEEWKIVPDLDKIKADLTRWKNVVEVNLALPGLDLIFAPQAIKAGFFVKASGALHDLLRDVTESNETVHTSARVRDFFDNCLKYHQAIAESHISMVQAAFDTPNPSAESSFRALLNQLVDDLVLYDAFALVKNPTDTNRLGEMYTIPGQNIRVYRSKDLSTPQPPHIAYDWFEDERIKAVYNNYELVYGVANMQRNGYGKPPLETVLEQMVGGLYGDSYIIEQFTNSNMPGGVFDLGPNVDQGERDAVDRAWSNRVNKGLRRIVFVSNPEGVKGFIPIPQTSNKDQDILGLLKFWAARKCAVLGLSLNDIGFTEDLHRTTAETQAKLTQARGIRSMASLIEGYLNGEVVKGWLWCRNNPDDERDLTGAAFPVFPFRDVKFEFVKDDDGAQEDQADHDSSMVEAGIMSINEVRRERGLPPVEGGDEMVRFGGSSPIRISTLPDIPGPQAEGGQPGGGDPNTPGGQPDGAQPPPGGDPNAQPQAQPAPQDNAEAARKSVLALGESIAKAITGDGLKTLGEVLE